MKLSLITETFPPEINGVAMTLHRVVDGLIDRGHTVEVVCPERPERAAFLADARFTLRAVPGLPIPGYGDLRFGLPAAGRLRQAWRAQRPDLVHIATEGPLGASASRVARQLGLPFVTTFHTNFHSYSGHYGYGFLRARIFWWLKRVRRSSLRTFVPSEELLEELRREGFERLSVLSRGVDTVLCDPARRDDVLRASWGVAPDQPVALYVGRVAGEKNLPLTVEAWERMRAHRPGLPLVVVGDGPARASLAARHPGIIFTGPQRGEALARHYASGDVFLFASTTETFGNVVTEAMASGLVVLAFDYAAARRHLRNGENGLTVPLHDAAGYLAAAASLAQTPFTEWSPLRTRARATAETISWRSILDDFNRELLAILAAHSLSPSPP